MRSIVAISLTVLALVSSIHASPNVAVNIGSGHNSDSDSAILVKEKVRNDVWNEAPRINNDWSDNRHQRNGQNHQGGRGRGGDWDDDYGYGGRPYGHGRYKREVEKPKKVWDGVVHENYAEWKKSQEQGQQEKRGIHKRGQNKMAAKARRAAKN
ncbi:hypothetical protein CLU79DRAFT_732919 [Phycomyces nitens]|nr:hypothetical protein CLU79DRAFT_732919 [Phycomyces nitens]